MNCLIWRLRGQCPYHRIGDKECLLQDLKQKAVQLEKKKALLVEGVNKGEGQRLLCERRAYDTGLIMQENQFAFLGRASYKKTTLLRGFKVQCIYGEDCRKKEEVLDLRIRAMKRRCYDMASSYNKLCMLLNGCMSYHRNHRLKEEHTFLALEEKEENQLVYCHYPIQTHDDLLEWEIQSFIIEENQKLFVHTLTINRLPAVNLPYLVGHRGDDKTFVGVLKSEKKVLVEEILFVMISMTKLIVEMQRKGTGQKINAIYVAVSQIDDPKKQLKQKIKGIPSLKLLGEMQPNGNYIEEQLLVRLLY